MPVTELFGNRTVSGQYIFDCVHGPVQMVEGSIVSIFLCYPFYTFVVKT